MATWCNFDTNDDGQLVCLEHSPMGAPALCTHAAADLERRAEKYQGVVEMARSGLEHFREKCTTLESRLARLEEEKMQAEASMIAARKLLALCVKWLPKDSDIREIVTNVGLHGVDPTVAYHELAQRERDFTNV